MSLNRQPTKNRNEDRGVSPATPVTYAPPIQWVMPVGAGNITLKDEEGTAVTLTSLTGYEGGIVGPWSELTSFTCTRVRLGDGAPPAPPTATGAASGVTIADAGNYYAATDVEGALQEVRADLAATTNGNGASLVGIEDAANNFAATNVETALAEIISDYAATTNGNGASKIGIEDAGTFTTAADVEAALAEIYQHLLTAQAPILFSLNDLREMSAGGDVGNAAAIGGVLASDTTPILRGDAAGSQEVSWAAANVDVVGTCIALPPDLDDTANCQIDLFVYTDNSGGGGIDAATFTVQTSWDGGALVSDTATDGTPATTIHKISATVAAADIPATPSILTILLTPAAHANDPTQLVGMRLLYKRKLLTS